MDSFFAWYLTTCIVFLFTSPIIYSIIRKVDIEDFEVEDWLISLYLTLSWPLSIVFGVGLMAVLVYKQVLMIFSGWFTK
jgi:hypothetical protein